MFLPVFLRKRVVWKVYCVDVNQFLLQPGALTCVASWEALSQLCTLPRPGTFCECQTILAPSKVLHFHPDSSSIQKGLSLAEEDAWSSGYQGILVAPFQGLASWFNSQVWKVNTFLSWMTTPLFRWKIRQGLGGLMAKMDKETDDYGARWTWKITN